MPILRPLAAALLAAAGLLASVCPCVSAASWQYQKIAPGEANRVEFAPQKARFLRLEIYSTRGSDAPAIDELEVYGGGEENLALGEGVEVSASSTIAGYAIHRVENLRDGLLGNDASWVAGGTCSADSPQYVEYRWPEPVEFSAVVFSRDRAGRFADRVPARFAVLVSDDGQDWRAAARIEGVSDPVGEMVHPGSHWLNVPDRGPCEQTGAAPAAEMSGYDASVAEAFVGEEFALLKTAGAAPCPPGTIQRHYPEFVEPIMQRQSVLPLPTVEGAPAWGGGSDAFWNSASSALVSTCAPDNSPLGPYVGQTAAAAVREGKLYVRLRGNRFLRKRLALVGVEGIPRRGDIIVQEGKLFWLPIDGGDLPADVPVPLEGIITSDGCEAAIPLEYLDGWDRFGIFVALCEGGRNAPAGGYPIHFRAAPLALSFDDHLTEEGGFVLRAESFCDTPLSVTVQTESGKQELTLSAGQPQTIPLPVRFGQAGPQTEVHVSTGEGQPAWFLNGFRYDPCYRPLCQLTDMLRRAEAPESDAREEKDFLKRVTIPGVLNPRYSDPEAIAAGLNLPPEYVELNDFAAALADGRRSDDPVLRAVEEELLPLWNRYRAERPLSLYPAFAERDLFMKIRLLKRRLVLSGDDLQPAQHLLANQRHPFHPSHNYSDLFDSQWVPGGAVLLIDIPRVDGVLDPAGAQVRRIVEAGDGVIRNPSQSRDATKIYYAHRVSQDEYFRIYELDLATGEKRRISPEGPFHDFWPTELPDGGLAFVSTRCKKKFICWRPQAFVLHRMEKDGSDLKALSMANLTEFAPSVMDDGRIIWTRSEYVDKGADYGHTLWTIRIDGTMPELVFGNTINLPQGYANGREVPETREVCCTLISHFSDLNGPIALIDLTKGPHDPSMIRSITPEVAWPGFSSWGETFREAYPISRDVYLVAHAPLDRFGIFLLDRYGNRELLFTDPAIDTICPQPFAPQPVPPVLKGVIKPDLAEKGLGQFSVANVYRGLEGQVEPGKARYLRVCRELPTPLAQLADGTYQADHEPFMEYYASPVDILQGPFGWPSYVAKGVIGTIEIEEDGSADFLVPAEQVLFFELLDENMNEIQRMRSVVQLQKGEQRSCIGCHESRLSTPTGSLTLASKNPGRSLSAPPWGAGPFWYERVVQPVLDKRCVECHTAETAEKKPRQFDLTGRLDADRIPASYRSLIQSGDVHYFDYTWGAGKTTKAAPFSFGTFQSRLWEILRDENHRGVSLAPEEEQAIKCWTDLNVPLWGDYQFRSSRAGTTGGGYSPE